MFDLNIIFILILFGCLSGFFVGLLGAEWWNDNCTHFFLLLNFGDIVVIY